MSNSNDHEGTDSVNSDEKNRDIPVGAAETGGEAIEVENQTVEPGDGSSGLDGGNPAGSEEVTRLQERVKELETENSELKNEYLRKQADFENFRKRMLRDKEESIKFANASLLQDLVQIIDDFERAIKSSESSKDFESFHSGIEMIEKQFTSMLERKYGLKRFESQGQEFDPEMHEAIAMEKSDEHDGQVVLEDFLKGYMLNDRVLRHAKVKVSTPDSSKSSDKNGGEE